MNEPIQRYFSVGTIQWMSFPPMLVPVLTSLKRIAGDDFFDAIEVTHIEDDRTRAKAIEILRQSHLRVGYGAQPCLLGAGLNPNALDEAQRQKAEERLLACVDEAHEMGAVGVAFLAGHYEEETKEAAFGQLVKTTRALCAYAAKKDLMIELEVFDYNMAKKSLIGPAPLAKRFAKTVRETESNFGLLVDLSHFPTTYEDSRFVIPLLKPYITHLHIGNAVVKPGCEAYGDEHPRFGFPKGANDTDALTEFFRVLREEGFFRENAPLTLSLEVKPWADEDCEIILANTKRVIKRAWALLEEA